MPSFLATDERIVQPSTSPSVAPGPRGHRDAPQADGSEVAVVNVAGELFMTTSMSPFRIVDLHMKAYAKRHMSPDHRQSGA